LLLRPTPHLVDLEAKNAWIFRGTTPAFDNLLETIKSEAKHRVTSCPAPGVGAACAAALPRAGSAASGRGGLRGLLVTAAGSQGCQVGLWQVQELHCQFPMFYLDLSIQWVTMLIGFYREQMYSKSWKWLSTYKINYKINWLPLFQLP
jgi:hypothetical protein